MRNYKISKITVILTYALLIFAVVYLFVNCQLLKRNYSDLIYDKDHKIEYLNDRNEQLEIDNDLLMSNIEELEQLSVRKNDELLSYSDIVYLAKLVYLEAGSDGYNSQVGVARVVLNRMTLQKYPNSLYDVIHQRGQFQPASLIDTVTPTSENISAVIDACRNTLGFPITVDSFRAGHYFEGPAYQDYVNYGNTYFSICR